MLSKVRVLGFAASFSALVGLSAFAFAQDVSVTVGTPELAPPPVGGATVVVETPSVVVETGPVVVEPAPTVVYSAPAPAVECCPIQVIRDHATLSAKRAYQCYGGPTNQVICVDNPADCCNKLYSVNVCVPACCVDTPVCVSSSVGLLGRGRVVYCWKCGFEAVITFRVHGGVLITYR